ncbi:Phage tail-collar fibre protein [Pseudovibrio ascidiaceicola]|uniref:Phage tail-collar fibre protein n=1 Tax=Pseudovibrio ascidiaceicola TaxID=285279 RepID=A0A1I4DZ11_9HYPH|nr:phage tail protein [Pseudovibrio ascidiaceicola]SFK98223.1 Phage tail-collar fibre protein [Pseudovibrio ascidiaceicola]
MSLKAINPTLTRAGMRAIFSASDAGLHARITHLAFGSSRYSPAGDETSLKSEKARVEIIGSRYLDDFQMEITAQIDGDTGFTLAELGVMLEDGTLLAVWSDPDTPLAQYTPGVPISFSFVLALTGLPQNVIQVTGDVDLQLFFGEEFAGSATSMIALQLENFLLNQTARGLSKELSIAQTARAELLRRLEVVEAKIDQQANAHTEQLTLDASITSSLLTVQRHTIEKDQLQ